MNAVEAGKAEQGRAELEPFVHEAAAGLVDAAPEELATSCARSWHRRTPPSSPTSSPRSSRKRCVEHWLTASRGGSTTTSPSRRLGDSSSARSRRPCSFAHGEHDRFVPPSHAVGPRMDPCTRRADLGGRRPTARRPPRDTSLAAGATSPAGSAGAASDLMAPRSTTTRGRGASSTASARPGRPRPQRT
jgi:hypothetical protein